MTRYTITGVGTGESCVFTSLAGVASCGTHVVNLDHLAENWRCPNSGVLFQFGDPLGTLRGGLRSFKLVEDRKGAWMQAAEVDALLKEIDLACNREHRRSADSDEFVAEIRRLLAPVSA